MNDNIAQQIASSLVRIETALRNQNATLTEIATQLQAIARSADKAGK